MSTLLYSAHLRANGIRQHYLRYGGDARSGDPVILIPGITSPAITWGFVGEQLGRVLDVYILDVRGRGLSEAGDALDYGLQAQADDALAFASALGLERFSVLGHSMGARIGARIARGNPSALARLAMIDPPVSGPGRRPYPMQLSWYLDSIRKSCEGMDAQAMRAYCPTWSLPHLRLRAEWLHTCDERAIAASFAGFAEDDFHADLAQVKAPLLLMTAGRGEVILPTERAELMALASHMVHREVANAGHMIPYDDEPGFYAALGDFLGTTIPPLPQSLTQSTPSPF